MALAPRAVVVHRRSELDELVDRHGTRGQVEFVLRTRGRTLTDLQARHDALAQALHDVRAGVPDDWRRGEVERTDLHRFAFEPEDVCLVVGPDGLVANTAKYLDRQPVVGIDPEPGRNAGALVRHRAPSTRAILGALTRGDASWQERTLVRAALDDGTVLDALNDIYVGDAGHQSARYQLRLRDGRTERQSSSGIVVATGTGSTGWATSLARQRAISPPLPATSSGDLVWFVREAWPSPVTGTELTAGALPEGWALTVQIESDALVLFGDGLEADRVVATWGQTVELSASGRRLRLVV
ncbi:MAG TPA: hypothetical protein VGK17_25280 [Propionicimonas sp.]|jgi:hypothetical protein